MRPPERAGPAAKYGSTPSSAQGRSPPRRRDRPGRRLEGVGTQGTQELGDATTADGHPDHRLRPAAFADSRGGQPGPRTRAGRPSSEAVPARARPPPRSRASRSRQAQRRRHGAAPVVRPRPSRRRSDRRGAERAAGAGRDSPRGRRPEQGRRPVARPPMAWSASPVARLGAGGHGPGSGRRTRRPCVHPVRHHRQFRSPASRPATAGDTSPEGIVGGPYHPVALQGCSSSDRRVR
jgi:hypothetical protein